MPGSRCVQARGGVTTRHKQVADGASELDAPSLRSPGSVGAAAFLGPATLTSRHCSHLPGRRHSGTTPWSEGGDTTPRLKHWLQVWGTPSHLDVKGPTHSRASNLGLWRLTAREHGSDFSHRKSQTNLERLCVLGVRPVSTCDDSRAAGGPHPRVQSLPECHSAREGLGVRAKCQHSTQSPRDAGTRLAVPVPPAPPFTTTRPSDATRAPRRSPVGPGGLWAGPASVSPEGEVRDHGSKK